MEDAVPEYKFFQKFTSMIDISRHVVDMSPSFSIKFITSIVY